MFFPSLQMSALYQVGVVQGKLYSHKTKYLTEEHQMPKHFLFTRSSREICVQKHKTFTGFFPLQLFCKELVQLEDISCPPNNAQVNCTHFSNTSCWISQSLTYPVEACLQHWNLGNKSLISYFVGVLSLSMFKVCGEKQCQYISIINLFKMRGIFFIYCAVRSTKVILAV